VASEGEWTSEDADWTYKDIPHFNFVHSLTRSVPAVIDEKIFAAVHMQRIAGIPVPIALADYVTAEGTQVYFTTFVCFVLVVETKIIPIADDLASEHSARVETTYHIGGPRFAMFAFPLIRRILRANYKVLMAEDLPMRERRGRLRRAGYSFASDGRPRTFIETTDLTIDNVVSPPLLSAARVEVDLNTLKSTGASVIVGDGPAGLRLLRSERSEVLIFDRICVHEGSSLDEAPPGRDCLVCPWHGKRVQPLASFDVTDRSRRRVAAGPHRSVEIDGDRLIVSSLP
jgi:nitrite reductase/ring-hydroxylating ferredoxin subunit